MTDFKKHKRRKFRRERQHELIDRCIYKGYLIYVVNKDDGQEYVQLTEKGEQSMDIDAEELRKLVSAFEIEKPKAVREPNNFNVLKRKNRGLKNE